MKSTLPARLAAHQTEEVAVFIRLCRTYPTNNWDMEWRTIEKRFARSEDAWSYIRQTEKQTGNRRNKAERETVTFAASCGCTINGNSYGNILTGSEGKDGAPLMSNLKALEEARVQAIYTARIA